MPKRCQRMLAEKGTPIPVQCPHRVFKSGLCTEHYASMKIARVQLSSMEVVEVKRCHVYKCFKTATITMEHVLWCTGHYIRWQKSVSRHKRKIVDKLLEVPTNA